MKESLKNQQNTDREPNVTQTATLILANFTKTSQMVKANTILPMAIITKAHFQMV
jgi:hypothetical protein